MRTDEDAGRERKTSWLELFYDLVFVVVVSALAHFLAEHPTPWGLASFVLMFLPAIWLWISGTFYTERFEVEDVSHRVFTFLQMVPVALLAVFVAHGTGATSRAFALTYAAGRLIIIGLWFRAGLHDRRAKPVTDRYTIGFLISVALFVASVFVPTPWRFALWLVALAIDFATPLTTLSLQAKLPRYSSNRLPERFGLFVLIVLGENVVSVISGVAAHDRHGLREILMGGLGMAIAIGFWWVYFDLVNRRAPKPGLWWGLARNYLHIPLIIAITATAAATLNLVAGHSSPGAHALLAGSVGVALACLAALHSVLKPPVQKRAETELRFVLWGAVLACVALVVFAKRWDAVAVLAALAGIHLGIVVYGTVAWARGRLA